MPRKKSSHKTYEQSIAAVLALERGRGGNLIEILRSLATKIFGGPTAEGVSRDEILQYHLTPREREVMRLIARGYTNNQIADSLFGIPLPGSPLDGMWFDLPANRHNDGCNLSFADGHVEHWKWAVPKVFRSVGQPVEPQAEWRDYDRLRDHIRKTLPPTKASAPR